MKKKLLALFLCLTFVFSAFSSIALYAEDPVETIPAAGYTYDEATDTYTVYTADGLIAVGAEINAGNYDGNIVLAADIDLTGKTWAPLVAKNPGYSGTIDGAGFEISGLSLEGGARLGFISRGNSCTVKNLTFVNPVVAGTAEYNAVIIGDITYAIEGVPAVIDNCHIVNGKVTGVRYSGALVGATAPADLVIKNCTVDADVENSKDNAAMLLGGDRGACKNVTFENIIVTGSATSPLRGGLTGYVCDAKFVFKNVVSFAEVSVAGTNVSGLMGQAKRNVIEVSNVIVPGSPLSSLDAFGEKKNDTITINNLYAIADGETVTLLDGDTDPVISNAEQTSITINGTTIETSVDAWKAATVPAINGIEAVVAKIGEIFADNATFKAAAIKALYESIAYTYDEATDTYTVYSADGFIAAADQITTSGNDGAGNFDANIVLAVDIDMNDTDGVWNPLCNRSGALYTGTIDGQGYTIKNFTDKNTAHRRGLIARAAGCTIKNLTLVDPVVQSGKNSAFIVGAVFGGSATDVVTIENCNIINGKIDGGSNSYIGALVGCGEKAPSITIRNCVVDAEVKGAAHTGMLLGGESGAATTAVYTFENIIATGSVTGKTNAGLTGYMCDLTANYKNILSLVEAKNATNTSSLMANSKRCTVSLTNVICTGTPIASADALGEKVVNDINVNNVFALADEDVKLYKSFGIHGANAVNYNGTPVTDLSTITVPAVDTIGAKAKILEIFAENEALKEVALQILHDEIGCAFDQEVVAEEYFAAKADCYKPTQYFKSCEICQKAGTETFGVGEVEHKYGDDLAYDETQHWGVCTICGSTDPAPHVMGEWEVVIEATEDEQGLRARYCVCGFSEERVIPKVDHLHKFVLLVVDEFHLASEATCTTKATYYKSCACGENGTETFQVGGLVEHTYGTELKADENNHFYACTVCGAQKDAALHIYDQKVAEDKYFAADASCAAGKQYYLSCACGKAGTKTFAIGETLPHTFGEWTVEVAPTELELGKEVSICKDCGHKEYRDIDRLPSDYIFVSTEAELKAALETLNANVVLLNDITLTGEWTPVGKLSAPFKGSINGRGFSIKNLVINNASLVDAGLFAATAEGFTASNLTFDGVEIIAKQYAGALVGRTAGDITVTNCHVKNAVIVAATNYAAGFVGRFEKGAGTETKNATFENCSVNAILMSAQSIGGIAAGEAASGSINFKLVCKNCVTAGVYIDTNGGGNARVGGLFGYSSGVTCTFENCVSLAEIRGGTNDNGGIAAIFRSGNFTYTNCVAKYYLAGSITGEAKYEININNSASYFDSKDGTINLLENAGSDKAKLFIDGVATDWKNAKVPALDKAATVARIKAIFADNAELLAIALDAIHHEHVYNQEDATPAYLATEATCTAKATYYKSCSCGLAGTKTFEAGEIGDHTYDQEVVADTYFATAATCTAKATYYKSCACGAKGTETFETGDLLAHVFDKEVATEAYLATAATCTAKATYYKSCACGEKGTETFESGETIAHVFDKEVVADGYLASAATCAAKATYYKSCACGEKGTETFETGDLATEHTFGDWTTVKEPTETEEGSKERVCSVCSKKETESIDKLPATTPDPEPTPEPEPEPEPEKGCGGAIGGASIVIMLAAAGAVVARKKKED